MGARSVVAHAVAAEVHAAHKHAQEVETAKALVASKHLSDPHFNSHVKTAMLKALLAAGVISDINDPKLKSMTAEEAAKMLADADIDPSKIKDPAVAAAIRLAHRVAACDVHAARHVAAHAIAGKVVAASLPSGHGHLPLGSHKVVLKHAFVKKAKGLLLNALSAVGLMSHPIHSSDWKDVTLRKAANRLDSLNLTPESVDDPVVRKALVLARAIAQDDVVKAQGIVADETSEHSEAVDTLASRMSSAEAVQSSQSKS